MRRITAEILLSKPLVVLQWDEVVSNIVTGNALGKHFMSAFLMRQSVTVVTFLNVPMFYMTECAAKAVVLTGTALQQL
jgi:hypothetical protein